MKVYVITSTTSEVPLAEIRTDGNGVEFTVDNTEGKLPSMIGNSLQKLKAYVAKTSNIEMSEPDKPTAHILRYVLDNGDVVEITTDGKTAILNGRLLKDSEKNALFSAIRSGEIKVAHRAQEAAAIPVLPGRKKEDLSHKLIEPEPLDRSLIAMAREANESAAQLRSQADRSNDDTIENADLSDLDTPDDEAMTRGMMYYVRHGGFKGDDNG